MTASQNRWPISPIVWWHSRFLRTSKQTALRAAGAGEKWRASWKGTRPEGGAQGTGDARGKRWTRAPFLTRATEVPLGRTTHPSSSLTVSFPTCLTQRPLYLPGEHFFPLLRQSAQWHVQVVSLEGSCALGIPWQPERATCVVSRWWVSWGLTCLRMSGPRQPEF